MKDTPPDVEALQYKIWMAKPLDERVRLGMEMLEEGFEIVRNSIKANNPSFGEREIVVAMFKRLYNDNFSVEEQTRIIDFLSQTHIP
jgi:hypothetical protein